MRFSGCACLYPTVEFLACVRPVLTATALMSDTCPVKDCLHMPSRMSHSLEVASQAPETKVL